MRNLRRRPTRRPRAVAARPRDRRGIALLIALLAVVTIGALLGGAFFASMQEYRIGRNSVYEPRAIAAAERGLNSALEAVRGGVAVLAANGDTASLGTFVGPGGADSATVRLTRLTPSTYALVSEGVAGSNAEVRTTRRSQLLMRLAVPQLNVLAALTARGATKIGGSSEIDGNDHAPPGWACPGAGAALPGIVNDDPSANITTAGSKVIVSGNPPIQQNPAAADTSTYFKFGSEDWETLTSSAELQLPVGWGGKPAPVVAGGVCVPGLNNWGDVTRSSPASKCEKRFPVIYAAGDLALQGGSGQGILLVEGDLKVTGGFEFYGPVIVRGTLSTQGTGGHFNGGVMAANVNLDQNVVLGNAVISYSRCAIDQALKSAASLRPVADRGWAALY